MNIKFIFENEVVETDLEDKEPQIQIKLLKGERGAKGERGEQGIRGLKGDRGDKGDKGDKRRQTETQEMIMY